MTMKKTASRPRPARPTGESDCPVGPLRDIHMSVALCNMLALDEMIRSDARQARRLLRKARAAKSLGTAQGCLKVAKSILSSIKIHAKMRDDLCATIPRYIVQLSNQACRGAALRLYKGRRYENEYMLRPFEGNTTKRK